MRTLHTLTLSSLAALALACGGGDSTGPGGDVDLSSPVGSFTLATVNGTQVPMLWEELDVGIGTLRSYWIGGKLTFKSDSTFTVSYQHKLTGPGLAGNVKTDVVSGTWRLPSPGQLAITTSNGTVSWQTTEQIFSVTRTTTVPALGGGTEQVIFVWVRD